MFFFQSSATRPLPQFIIIIIIHQHSHQHCQHQHHQPNDLYPNLALCYSVTISNSSGQVTFISNWLVCSCRICRWSNILSVIIFWVRKTCNHLITPVILVLLVFHVHLLCPLLFCPLSLLSSPLLSTNPFLSHTSPPSSNPFLTASWWAIRRVTSILADHKE